MMRMTRWLLGVCAFCVMALSARAALTEGLLAEWKFDEGKGEVARDSSGHERHAAVSGASWAPLKEGFALSFDGVDDYASFEGVPPLALSGVVSIQAWIKPERAAERLTILLGQDLHSYLLCVYGQDRVGWYVGRGTNQVSAQIRMNEWNHVAATFDGKEMILWINGEEAGRQQSAVGEYPSRDRFSMVAPSPNLPKYKGLMDHVRVYNRALSAEEVSAAFVREAEAHAVKTRTAQAPRVSPDEAVRFFKSHPNEIDALEQGGSLLFANRQVGLEFAKSSTGFELARLYGIAEDHEFLTPPSAAKPRDLFEIRMGTDPKFVRRDDRGTEQDSKIGEILDRMAELGNVVAIGSQAAKSVSWRLDKGADSGTLHLESKGMDVRNEQGVLDATVTVTLRAGDPLACWRISLRNRSARHGVERVRMPILPLAPIRDAKRNVFIYPKWRGGYREDPFNAPPGLGENYHTTGAYYPYYTNMQFWALYNSDVRNGIYVGTRDPKPCMTHTLVTNTPTEITWSVSHFPPNMSYAGEDFALPYDCVVGPFRGDWYDAAQIYRAWAVRQSWCRKGPLAARSDAPSWHRESPLFFYTLMNDSATGTHDVRQNLRIAADHFREWLRWARVPLPLALYAWHDYDPGLTASNVPFHQRREITIPGQRWTGLPLTYSPFGNYPKVPAMPGFAEEVARLRGEGGMVTPYVCLQVFDPGPFENSPYATEAKPNMVMDSYGRIHKYPGMNMWYPCVAGAWWQNRLAESCATLVEREKAAGFYLDVMHGVGMPCFWTPHGHSHGGGSAMTEGMHTLAQRIREASQAKDPDAITTGESSAENMIDVIDGLLYQYTLRPENRVPLFGVVYNDYIARHGRELSVSRPRDFFIESSSLFVEGAQVGRIRLRPRSDILQFENSAHKEMIDFLGRIVGYYRQEGVRKFLVYGQLLRPLDFRTPSPMPQLVYGAPDSETLTDIGAALGPASGTAYPALMSGVFRAPDGDLGVFVVNAGESELVFEADLEAARYGLAANATADVTVLSPDGTVGSVASGGAGRVSLRGALAGRGITFFRLAFSAR